jgi:hypothetical protein
LKGEFEMKMNCWVCGTELEVPEEKIQEFKKENPGEEPLAACGKISCSPYFQPVMGNYLRVVKEFSDGP